MWKKIYKSEKKKNIKYNYNFKFKVIYFDTVKVITLILLLQDMNMLVKSWRQIKGYNSNGQRSHSNNNGNKKNKLLLNYRIQQFYQMFGKKKRDIFPSLVIAEYNNRLWMYMWFFKWLEARTFIFILAHKGRGKVKFDPQLLSKNIVTGIKQVRKKKKHNAAKKKILLIATIGLPLLFTKFLYRTKIDKVLPFILSITDDSRRKMGKKKKKNKK